MGISVGIEGNVGHVEEAGSSESCLETTRDSCLTCGSLRLEVKGNLDFVTTGVGRRSITSSTRFLTVGHHVGRVSGAPSGLLPRATIRLFVEANRLRRSGVALVARFLAVREHVPGVILAFALSSPG